MKNSRRTLLRCGCLGLLQAATWCPGWAGAAHAAAPLKKTALSPDEALQALRDGNRRFLANQPPAAPQGRERRLELAQGQAPFAALVSCSDSRAPPELLFNCGLGELFTMRNAGNTVDTATLGSIEYAVAVLGVPLVVVMGHERCGAVEAAIDVVNANRAYPGSIGPMIEPIIPAVLQARSNPGDLLDNAVRENVSRTVRRLQNATEPMLLQPQRENRLKVIGARYDLQDGLVEFF